MGVLSRSGLICAILLGACSAGQTDVTASGTTAAAEGHPVRLPNGGGAMAWGSGSYGVVLVHDAGASAAIWQPAARAIAADRMAVLAVEPTDGASVRAAIAYLKSRGALRVALIGAGRGADAVLELGRDDRGSIDQVITISARGDAARLGAFPKLFIASQGEAAAADARRMAAEAPGAWNELLIVPGSASGAAILASPAGPQVLNAALRRLGERR